MNMKTLAVLVLMGLSYVAFAQQVDEQEEQQTETNGNQPRQNNNNNLPKGLTQEAKACWALKGGTPGPLKEGECAALEKLSQQVNQVSLYDEPAVATTAKNEMTCIRRAGYTLDFPACNNAVKAMNAVINAESGLLLAQQVRTDVKNKNIQEQTTKQVASGDGVAGVFDASIAQNKHLKAMEQEKALAYSAAVAALTAAYGRWPKKEKLVATYCGGDPACQNVAGQASGVVANENAKGALALKITEYIAKGLAAGIKMGQFNTRAEAVEKAKDSLNPEDEDAMIERCMFNPTDPLCATPGNRVAGPSYGGGGDFSLGDGGNNSFDMGDGNNDFGEEGSAPTIGDKTVAGTNSPFEDAAKAANGILDPAAAASMQPGSAPGAGGGGVGGGGGGGSASLGSDLEGAEKEGEKDPSLKTSKSSGNYAFGAGGGYQAVKGGKDDANPFASLFDSKSSGGLEEDRSIASASDGPGSGLFQRISKRYSEVQSQKRIEANNLE